MKKYFEWTDDLSVNIEEIDDQHKEFINIANGLYISIVTGKGNDALGGILSKLVEYATIHFATEERLMKIHGYSGLAVHSREHQELRKQLLKLHDRFNEGKPVPADSVANFLTDWLAKHIRMTDMQFGSFLNSKGVT